jgi:NAD(P)-dependent dehydrogenase (short-subunit alcohol dehydrogenase family)
LKLADELAPRNITVNVLALGFFPTKMTDSLDVYGKDLKEEITKNRLLIKRVGRPSDVAGAAIYLASEAASWVTGVVLKVDGGFLSKL